MPQRSQTGCKYPGCNAVIKSGTYCERHSKEHRSAYDKKRGSAAKRGYDAKWRRDSKMYLRAHPLCVDIYHDHPGQVVIATQTDHIIPKSKGGKDEWSNYQGLCDHCHSKKIALEDGGWGRVGQISGASNHETVGQTRECVREMEAGGIDER